MSEKKRILHVIESLGFGGAEQLLLNTISELHEFDHLIVSLFAVEHEPGVPANAKHICFNVAGPALIPFQKKKYQTILKHFQPSLVHSHLYFAVIFTKWLTPRKIPLVFTQHYEFSKNATKWYYSYIDKLLSKKWHHCVAVSQSVLKDYQKTTSFPGITHVIYNFIPDKYFEIKKEQRSGRTDLKLVSVGNIKPIKNQSYLVDAFQFLKELNVSCDVYGEGAGRTHLQQKAKARGVKVCFKGAIADASTVLGKYDIFIMASATEGFGLALLEAMAAGLPVIVTDIPVFRELLKNDGNYMSLNSPQDLKTTVVKFLQHPQLLDVEGQKMKLLASQIAKKEIYLQKLLTVYRQLMGT